MLDHVLFLSNDVGNMIVEESSEDNIMPAFDYLTFLLSSLWKSVMRDSRVIRFFLALPA